MKSAQGHHRDQARRGVLAIGAEVYTPTEYLYGQDERVMTHLELEEKIAQNDEKVTNAQSLVMIQCVGCRNEETELLQQDLLQRVGEECPAPQGEEPRDGYLHPLPGHKDLRVQEKTTTVRRPTRVSASSATSTEQIPRLSPVRQRTAGPSSRSRPSTISSARNSSSMPTSLPWLPRILPSAQTKEVAGQFKVTLSPDGFFKEAHVKLRPVEFATDGVYLAGLAHYPKFISETINQSYGAAGRVLTLLSHDTVVASGSVCEVDEDKCVSCGACITACTYGAIEFYESPARAGRRGSTPFSAKETASAIPSVPPTPSMLKHFTDEEIVSEIDAHALTKRRRTGRSSSGRSIREVRKNECCCQI